MTVFIAKRLGFMIVTMVVASFLVFGLMEFSPGNVASHTCACPSESSRKFSQLHHSNVSLGLEAS